MILLIERYFNCFRKIEVDVSFFCIFSMMLTLIK